MEKIRLGVVGLGHRGREMFKLAAQGFDFVVAAAACDIRPHNFYEKQWLSSDALSNIFPDTEFYESYDEMLKKANLDAVMVETGADIHAEFCIKALKKGINVLSDIPVVATLKEAEDLWQAANESSAMISVGANPNYQRFATELKEFYEKGLLGKPYCLEGEYIHWALPGGEEKHLTENGEWRKMLVPIRYCTHSLGPLLAILEEELRYVSCFGTGAHSDDGYGCFGEFGKDYVKDDMMCAQFRTESGVVVRLMRNGRCRADIGHHNYRVFGTDGYMERMDRMGKATIRYNSYKSTDARMQEEDGRFMPKAYESNPKAQGHDGMDYAMLDAFFKALMNGDEAPVSLKEWLLMTLPGIYAEESAKALGKVVRMRYPWENDWTTVIE